MSYYNVTIGNEQKKKRGGGKPGRGREDGILRNLRSFAGEKWRGSGKRALEGVGYSRYHRLGRYIDPLGIDMMIGEKEIERERKREREREIFYSLS